MEKSTPREWLNENGRLVRSENKGEPKNVPTTTTKKKRCNLNGVDTSKCNCTIGDTHKTTPNIISDMLVGRPPSSLNTYGCHMDGQTQMISFRE